MTFDVIEFKGFSAEILLLSYTKNLLFKRWTWKRFSSQFLST